MSPTPRRLLQSCLSVVISGKVVSETECVSLISDIVVMFMLCLSVLFFIPFMFSSILLSLLGRRVLPVVFMVLSMEVA